MSKILIIDDEEKLRSLLTRLLNLEGFEILQACNGKNALKIIKQIPEIKVVLCDVKLPDVNGVDLIKDLLAINPTLAVISLTAYGNITDGVKAMRNGAFDYLTKGDDNNRIIPLIYKALENCNTEISIVKNLVKTPKKYGFNAILGTSNAIKAVITLAEKVSKTDATVFITGETGTGKEVFAQSIHQESLRNQQAFIAVNCAAFSKDLLESELFGHKEGAFTGASSDHKGLFEAANHGTLFLDEIAEMPLELQAKLLRVLEDGTFYRIGESKSTEVNVRIIAATNKNLQKEIENKNFREDLFYRISVFQIELPPLRDRIEDIPLFVDYFQHYFSEKTNKALIKITNSCLETLQNYHWKGNIRELKNVIERSIILSEAPIINTQSLPKYITAIDKYENKETLTLAETEKIHIEKVLHYTHGNKTKTAEILGIALTTLYRKMDEYKL